MGGTFPPSFKKVDRVGPSMAFRPVQWFFTNRFIHTRSFLGPSLHDRAVPRRLRERIERRLEHAIRMAKVRIALFVMLYAAVIATVGAAVANFLADVFGSRLFTFAGEAFAAFVGAAAIMTFLAIPGIAITNRTLSLLEAEIYVLGMEAVARCVHQGDAILPSEQHVRRRSS